MAVLQLLIAGTWKTHISSSYQESGADVLPQAVTVPHAGQYDRGNFNGGTNGNSNGSDGNGNSNGSLNVGNENGTQNGNRNDVGNTGGLPLRLSPVRATHAYTAHSGLTMVWNFIDRGQCQSIMATSGFWSVKPHHLAWPQLTPYGVNNPTLQCFEDGHLRIISQ